MGGLEIYLRVCSVIALAGAAIDVAAFFYTLVAINWKSATLHMSTKLSKETCQINLHFFIVCSHLILGFATVLLCVYEIFLIINPQRFNYPKNGYARGFFYIITGFTVLGVSSILGIAGGIITLIGAVLTFVNTALIKCDCMRMEAAPTKIQDGNEAL